VLISSQQAFLGLFAAVALERLFEMALSLKNGKAALARGGREYGKGHFPAMVALHVAFLIAAPAEVLLFDRPFVPALGWTAVVLVGATMALRYWAVTSLDGRWNARVIVEAGAPAVVGGPYRYLRHPNYLAVVVELIALPLVHSAWLTAGCFSLLNGFMLKVRIAVEEEALRTHCDYDARLGATARFVPGGGAP
jgi:methyltransferase